MSKPRIGRIVPGNTPETELPDTELPLSEVWPLGWNYPGGESHEETPHTRMKVWHIPGHTRRPLPLDRQEAIDRKTVVTNWAKKTAKDLAPTPRKYGSRCHPKIKSTRVTRTELDTLRENARREREEREREQRERPKEYQNPYIFIGTWPKSLFTGWLTLESAFQSHQVDHAISAQERFIEEHFPMREFSDLMLYAEPRLRQKRDVNDER